MYDSIQHFNEFGIKNIEKIIKDFIRRRRFLDTPRSKMENTYYQGRN